MDMNSLMKQAQQFQQKMQQIQAEAANRRVTSTAGGGMVTATANGRQELISLVIEPQVVHPDEVKMLEDLVVSAVNDALRKARESMQEEMKQLTGGISIPGLF